MAGLIVFLVGATFAAVAFMVWLAAHGLLALIRFVNWLVYGLIVPAVKGRK